MIFSDIVVIFSSTLCRCCWLFSLSYETNKRIVFPRLKPLAAWIWDDLWLAHAPVLPAVTIWFFFFSLYIILQAFTLDMYFHQYWQDPRLAFNKPNKQITLPGNVADRLWQPDTYFENSKKGEIHKLTTLNKVLVVKPDGGVFFSLRYITELSFSHLLNMRWIQVFSRVKVADNCFQNLKSWNLEMLITIR